MLGAPARDCAARPDSAQSGGVCAQAKPLISLFVAHGRPFPRPFAERLARAADAGQVGQVDKILAAKALLEIRINPESRVKVLRGPALAELNQGHERLFLIRILNEGGVTAPLRLSGPNLAPEIGQDIPVERNRWLRAYLLPDAGSNKPPRLTGAALEYLVIALSTREMGLRDATLAFDVGQGTQDLGFRGECAILFRCRPTPRR